MGVSLCTCSVATEEKREKRAEPWQLCSTVHMGTHSAVVTAVVAAAVRVGTHSAVVTAVVAAAVVVVTAVIVVAAAAVVVAAAAVIVTAAAVVVTAAAIVVTAAAVVVTAAAVVVAAAAAWLSPLLLCGCCPCCCVVVAPAAASLSPLLLLLSLLLLLLLPLLLLPLSLLLPLLLLLPLSSPSPSSEVAHLIARLPNPPLGSYHRCWGSRQPRRRLIRWRWAQGWSVGWDGMRDWGKRVTTNVVVRFRDAPHGPPTSWVPPYVSPYPNPPSNGNKPPTSL